MIFNSNNQNLSGFTLLEVLLVIGLIAFIGLLATPFTLNQLSDTEDDSELRVLASTIFDAQQRAYSGHNNTDYGIIFATESYTVFQGEDLGSATITETYELQGNLSISQINLDNGGSEIKFEQGSLTPSTFGNIQLTGLANSYTLTVNREGMVDYAAN